MSDQKLLVLRPQLLFRGVQLFASGESRASSASSLRGVHGLVSPCRAFVTLSRFGDWPTFRFAQRTLMNNRYTIRHHTAEWDCL